MGTEGMNPEFARRLTAMINASGGKLYIVSGYRSVAEQEALYQEGLARYGPQEVGKWVAPPGQSNHNHGIAADLGGDLAWAAENAGRFGLFFPMSWEPWHIELMDASVALPQGSHPSGGYDPTLGHTVPPEALMDPVAATMANLAQALGNPSNTAAMAELGQPADLGEPIHTGPTGTRTASSLVDSSEEVANVDVGTADSSR